MLFRSDLAIAKNDSNITLPLTISSDIKMIDCGGRPKPHELQALSYIKQNWHDVA